MSIPKSFVDKHIEDAEESTFFGVPLKELTKEELMACVVSLGEENRAQSQQHIRDMKFLQDLNRKK